MVNSRYIAASGGLVAAFVSLATPAAPGPHDNARKLIADAKCEACHISKVGGDGSSIYLRKDRRVTAKSKLLPQIERCNSDLGAGLFPDDEAAIAAYLNANYYKFKD